MSKYPYIIEYDSPWGKGRSLRFVVEADSFKDAARKAFETSHPSVRDTTDELTLRVAKAGAGLGRSADSDSWRHYEYVPGETKTITTLSDVRRI